MGSFSSKIRTSLHESNENSPPRSTSTSANQSEKAESTKPQAREGAANEEKAKAGNTAQEQPTESKTTSSFSWLASTPVECDPNMKKSKEKGKRQTEDGRDKAINIMKYSNGKYLRSVEMPSTSKPHPKQVQLTASSSSSSSEKHSKNYGKNNDDRQRNSNQVCDGARSGGVYPVGFGVAGKKDSTTKAWKTDTRAAAYSRDSKGEARNRHSPDENGR